ncbi:hypothetical protein [Iamia sp.]|nr:hypothetical protein [Iamia sp.]HXH58551.1 hypothetical protein [Iamia sp.]
MATFVAGRSWDDHVQDVIYASIDDQLVWDVAIERVGPLVDALTDLLGDR